MFKPTYILLVLSAIDVALATERFAPIDVCSNLSSIINVIKHFTDLSFDVDFNGANRILHGPATIKLTNDIVTSCEALEMDENTMLFLANIQDDIKITFRESTQEVEISGCTIVAHITVTKEKPFGHSITVRPHLIEVTGFSEIFVNGTEMDRRIGLELLRPDLTNALTASELARSRHISHNGSQVNPFLLKQLLEQIYQFFFYRLTVTEPDYSS